MREFCPDIPCICLANKSNQAFVRDQKTDFNEPLYFTDAIVGTNVQKAFGKIVDSALLHKNKTAKDESYQPSGDIFDEFVQRPGNPVFDMKKLQMRMTGEAWK